MFAYPYAALITGVLLTLAGVLTLARHYLLEPVSIRYPKAPFWLRNSMFLFATVLIYIGMKFGWVYFSGQPDGIPPQPAPSTQLLAVALFFYKAAMLGNIVRQRYPADTWRRLNHLTELVTCSTSRRDKRS